MMTGHGVARILGATLCACLTTAGCSTAADQGGRAGSDARSPESVGVPSTEASTSPPAVREAGTRDSFFLQGADQRSDGRTVTLDEAVLTGTSGWVVVHADSGGTLGPVIGTSGLLPPGTHTDVVVTFTEPPIASRARLHPMLHVESTGNTTFDFPNGDGPASAAGDIVMFTITIDIS